MKKQILFLFILVVFSNCIYADWIRPQINSCNFNFTLNECIFILQNDTQLNVSSSNFSISPNSVQCGAGNYLYNVSIDATGDLNGVCRADQSGNSSNLSIVPNSFECGVGNYTYNVSISANGTVSGLCRSDLNNGSFVYSNYFDQVLNKSNVYNKTEVNNTIDAKLITTIYLPTQLYVEKGVVNGGGNVGNISYVNNGLLNISENDTSGITVYINFTGVNQNITMMQYYLKYSQDGNQKNHYMLFQMQVCDDLSWETHGNPIGDSSDFNGYNVAMFDSYKHICGNTIRVRFIHSDSNYDSSDFFLVDMVNALKGLSVTGQTGSIDPRYLRVDGLNNMLNNISFSSGNGINASYILNPIWVLSANMSSYALSVFVNDLTLSSFVNDAGFISAETDPVWQNEKADYLQLTDQRFNDTSLINTKLNITDGRFNDTQYFISDESYINRLNGRNFTLNESKLNSTMDARFGSVTIRDFNWTVVNGGVLAGNSTSAWYENDGNTLNVSETGQFRVIYRFNLSQYNVSTFNSVYFRATYDGSGAHFWNVYIQDCSGGWENGYLTSLSSDNVSQTRNIYVGDPDNHICNGIVNVSFYHETANAIPTHRFYVDNLILIKGFASQSSTIDDSPYFRKDGSRIATGNFNLDGYNLSASYVLANGSIGIGNIVPVSRLSITPNSQNATNTSTTMIIGDNTQVGTNTDSYVYPFEFQARAGNNLRLLFSPYRRINGSAWQGTAYRLQYAVDNSFTTGQKAYVEIGAGDPTLSGGGFIALGVNDTDKLTISDAEINISSAVRVRSNVSATVFYGTLNASYINNSFWYNASNPLGYINQNITVNINLTNKNMTDVNCIKFSTGGMICGST